MDNSKLLYEMIMEIVSRASLKTLDVMRCTSKELNTLAYESYLLDLHKKRNDIVSGFIIQYMRRGWMYTKQFAPSPESSGLDLGFLPYNARILATSDQGIILFENCDYKDSGKDVYHVCKPTTKQVLALPNPKGVCSTRKFAIVVMSLKPLHYKIIRFSDRPALKRRRKLYTTYRCDIFDSLAWTWRRLKHVTLPYGVFLTNPQPITKSGSIYMLLTNNDILKFDMYCERWQVFSPPIACDQYSEGTSRQFVELLKYGGRLGLACKPSNDPNDSWEIWRLMRGHEVWEKMLYVCKEKEGSRESLKALYDLDTSVMVDGNTLLYYRFKQEGRDNVISKVVLDDVSYQMFSFRSDFEPLDLI